MAEERHQHQQDYPYYERYLDKGLLVYEVYAAGYSGGDIIHPSSRIDYHYTGNTLTGETITPRDEDGNVVSGGVVNYEWSTESVGPNKEIRRKIRI